MRFVIPTAPITKKNHQKIIVNKKTGRRMVIPSEQYREYEEVALFFLRGGYKLDCRCEVKCLFYMPTRRRVDLTNLLEAIDDCLVKAGVLADDNSNIIVSHDGSRVLYDKDNPRTEIYIRRLDE